jgi:4'-phosphopantetheinyl transferase
MIDIIYTHTDPILEGALIASLVEKMPEDTIFKLNQYKKESDFRLHLFGRVILLKQLTELGYPANVLEYLHYTPHGRPYLNGVLDFNISHSGNVVMCAMGDHVRLGIDVEKAELVDIYDYQEIFTIKEWDLIITSLDVTAKFYELWTLKEALVKAEGKGWSAPFKSIIMQNDLLYLEAKAWHYQKLDFSKGYVAHLVCDIPIIGFPEPEKMLLY